MGEVIKFLWNSFSQKRKGRKDVFLNYGTKSANPFTISGF